MKDLKELILYLLLFVMLILTSLHEINITVNINATVDTEFPHLFK